MNARRPGQRRRAAKHFITPQGAPTAAINVTPLVDVVLVLLIIFMVVTPLLDRLIALSLPDTAKVENTQDVPINQILVKVARDGALTINGRTVEPAKYVASLHKRLKNRAPADRVVFVDAEEQARYALLVAAIDGAKEAGAQSIGMATENPDDPDDPS